MLNLILKRLGRNAAGLALGLVAVSLPAVVGIAPIPPAFTPYVAMGIGVATNALAKAGRMLLEDGLAKKVAGIF